MKELLLAKATELKHGLIALLLTGICERVLSFFIKRTESIAANSTREVLAWGFKRLFKREKKSMQYSKTFEGPAGSSLTVSYADGIAKVQASETGSAGGGSVAGALKVKGSAEVELDAHMIIDAGLDLAAAKFPALKSLVDAAKAGIASELAAAPAAPQA